MQVCMFGAAGGRMRGLVLTMLVAAGAAAAAERSGASASFGRAMLSEFQYDPEYRTFNHGSFGATPRVVTAALREYQDRMEARPDPWFRGTYREEMRLVRADMAGFLNASTDDVVLVESASSAVNGIMRSMNLGANDKVIYLSLAYPMVKNVFSYLSEADNVQLIEQKVALPVHDASELVDAVRAGLDAHPDAKLVAICHISSVPALIHPVTEIAALAHSRGARVMVDGAHAIGQIPVDVTTLGADYYLSNGHKWLFSPKGSAVLWVRRDYQDGVVPTVISSEFQDSTFVSRFEYTGTRDYSNMLAMRDALAFRASIGGEAAIVGYIGGLAAWAGQYLAALWQTDLIAPLSMVGAMVDVRLPFDAEADAYAMQEALFDEHGIYIVVHSQNGVPYARLSAQIYLEEADFEELGGLVLGYAAKARQVQ